MHWPTPTQPQLIPSAAASIKLVLSDSHGYFATIMANRPSSTDTSTHVFSDTPLTKLSMEAFAYPELDARGVAVGTATYITESSVTAGQVVQFDLTFSSTITRMAVTPPANTMTVGDTIQLSATPQNSNGDTVFATDGAISWTSNHPDVCNVSTEGLVTCLLAGTAIITATERESGKIGEATMEVHPKPPSAGEERVNPGDGALMVWVPAGTFAMGITDMLVSGLRQQNPTLHASWFADQEPEHMVTLDGFWIYKYEVTVAQYRTFCQASGRAMPTVPSWGWQDNLPITGVTWDDATAYASWAGAKLPTEAQWERAARGTTGKLFVWGGMVFDPSKCASAINSNAPQQVGSFSSDVSPYGAHDMEGNVGEYCSDFYLGDYYAISPSSNPPGPPPPYGERSAHVTRGGNWFSSTPLIFILTYRGLQDGGSNITGFRCSVTPAN